MSNFLDLDELKQYHSLVSAFPYHLAEQIQLVLIEQIGLAIVISIITLYFNLI